MNYLFVLENGVIFCCREIAKGCFGGIVAKKVLPIKLCTMAKQEVSEFCRSLLSLGTPGVIFGGCRLFLRIREKKKKERKKRVFPLCCYVYSPQQQQGNQTGSLSSLSQKASQNQAENKNKDTKPSMQKANW